MGDSKSALILGFGAPEGGGEGKGELPMLLRAFARAIRQEDYDKAAKLFEEAIAACDYDAEDRESEHDDENPFKRRGHDDEDDDDGGGGLKF